MPYTAKQLYDLAIDIESYPEFVPLCKRARVEEPVNLDDGTIQFDSLLIFRFRKFGIYEEFESRITADPNQTTILSESDGPPFTSFNAEWSFVVLFVLMAIGATGTFATVLLLPSEVAKP